MGEHQVARLHEGSQGQPGDQGRVPKVRDVGQEQGVPDQAGPPEGDRELAAANAAGKSVMLDFYADWCISCIEMEEYTFIKPDVQAALANTVTLQADVTKADSLRVDVMTTPVEPKRRPYFVERLVAVSPRPP